MLFRLWNVDKKSFIARNRIIGGDERTFDDASDGGPRWIKNYFSSRAESLYIDYIQLLRRILNISWAVEEF